MSVIGAHSLEELVATLKRPRRVMMLVKAGQPVDDFIEKLIPLLEPGDIIIDGGNSNYEDSIRRTAYVESKGLLFVGSGVSGGEEGARHGPSLMPGGSPAAWPHIKPIFQAVAAKVPEGDPNGAPCCDWVGENGAGPLRQDGAQRHRVRRHADHRRSLPAHERGPGTEQRRDERRLRPVEHGRPGIVPHRDHPRHPGLPRRRGPGGGRYDPRQRGAEGHRQVDRGPRRSTRARR